MGDRHRTRAALLSAAAELADAGDTPTVPMAAERAGISRATAYRYFPSQEMLIVELSLPIRELRHVLARTARDDTRVRIGAMVRTVAEWSFDHKLVLREMLRISLSSEGRLKNYRRPTKRLELIAKELEPLRESLAPREFRRLSQAMALLLGVEALVVLEDIVGLSRREVIATLEWTALRLLDTIAAP